MPVSKRLRHRLEYAGFLAVGAMIRALPLETASRWSGALWRLVAPRLHRHQRALNNLRLAFPEKSAAEIEQIALGSWENLGRTFAEFFHIGEIVGSDRIQFEPPERYDALAARHGAIVACSLHMANWELASQAALRAGRRPMGVYQRITNPFVDRYVSAVRAPFYPGGLLEKSARTGRALLRYAAEGGCAAFLADQRGGRDADVPFFGRPAPSTTFPAQVARTANAPIYICRALRLDGVRFSIRFEEVPTPRTDDRDADIIAATAAMQAAFERMIREAPEQWMWAHRRWD